MRQRLALILGAMCACASEPPSMIAAPTDRASAEPAPSAAPVASAAPKAKHAPPLVWEKDDEVAAEIARRERRPRLVVFCAEWSAPCKEQRRALSGPEFDAVARRFVLAWIDLTDDDSDAAKRAAQRYDIKTIPSVVVFDAAGNERLRRGGFSSNDPLLDALRNIY